MARETLDVRCNTDGSWNELDSNLSGVVVEGGRGVFKACYWWNGRQYVQNMSLIDMRHDIRISPKMATMSAARNLRIGESILGLANFDIGLTKWFDCRVLQRPIVSGRGVCVEVQWNTSPFLHVSQQIRNRLLYTEFYAIRILHPSDVLTNEQYRCWTEELCSIVPGQTGTSLAARNTSPATQFFTPIGPERGTTGLIPGDLVPRSNTGFSQLNQTTVAGNSYVPLRGPKLQFNGPFQLPGRPSAASWNPIPRIPQTRVLSPSLRGSGGIPAEVRRDPNLLPFPAPIRIRPPLSASRPLLNIGREETRTEPPHLVAPREELETITIVEDSSDDEEQEAENAESKETEHPESQEAGIADSMEVENSTDDQSKKQDASEDAAEESDEDRTPTLKDLNKFGLFLLAMACEKPGFDADEWIKKQKGTLAVLKVKEDE